MSDLSSSMILESITISGIRWPTGSLLLMYYDFKLSRVRDMATIKLNSHTGCRLITLSAIDVDISNMSFTTEKKDKDASTESQDMESQNVLTDNVNWGYAFTEKGYKYSTFCYADSLMLAHDLNVGIDVDYKIKENFLNYAKDILKTKSGKPYIYSSGYVKAGALEFTQE